MTSALAIMREQKTAMLKRECGHKPEIVLPWPPKELSPNARVHWAVKARAARLYCSDCKILLFPFRLALAGRYMFKVTFRPPDSRRRDRDNCIASFKAGQDALSLICQVDDSKFSIEYAPLGGPFEFGAVLIEVLA